jgi:ParB-like chromosome segregation protein Spo0J
MKILKFKVKDLKPSEYNPRKLSKKELEGIKESLDEFGLVEPLVVNENPDRYGVIVGGHQRYFILKEEYGDEYDVEVSVVNLPLELEQKLNLRLNKNIGSWDWDLLANFEKDFLLDVGFEPLEIDTAFSLLDLKDVDLDTLKDELQKQINQDDSFVIYKFEIPRQHKEMIDTRLSELDSDVNKSFLKLFL